MKSSYAVLAAAAVAACAEGPKAETPHPEAPAATKGIDMPKEGSPACTLLVAFGSYAMGIDGEALRRIEGLLGADPAVIGVTRSPRGREGEVTLCAAVRSEADRDRIFSAIAALFPRRPRGPLSVRTNDGREFHANNGT